MADKRYGQDPETRRQAKAAARGKKPAAKRKPARRRSAASGGPASWVFLSAMVRWALAPDLDVITSRGFGGRCLVVLALAVGYFYTTLPPLGGAAGRARARVGHDAWTATGDVFAWRGDQFGGVVTAESVSPHLKNAVIATEDKRFYSHFGLSPRGIASAVRINLSRRARAAVGPRRVHHHAAGGQTDLSGGTVRSRLRHDGAGVRGRAAGRATCSARPRKRSYSMAMEFKYSKDDILSIYLNRAYMGGGAFGAEAAAQRFFGKSAAEVSPAEGAMLAGLLTAPSTLSPTSTTSTVRRTARRRWCG